jgi:hypothetical protein
MAFTIWGRRGIACVAIVVLAACKGDSPTSIQTTQPPDATTFPGFDAATYPGTAAMRAWVYPSSPYYWTGYYLPAPCHRDLTWSGTRSALAGMGWGITAIYVGQQDWTQIPDLAPLRSAIDRPAAREERATTSIATTSIATISIATTSIATTTAVTCSASLLTSAQGGVDAADAIDRMRADGFPDGSIIFLDVEYVTTVTAALRDYYRGWISAVLHDGHFKPGIYAAKSNVSALDDEAVAAFRAAGSNDTPPFWIASSVGFSIGAKPSAVGFDFARLWQGMFDVTQTWNGVPITIDVDVAANKSPSAP